MIADNIAVESGVSGVVRELRAAPDFFQTVFKARNSNKILFRLLSDIGECLDSEDESELWAFYLLVMIDIDLVLAGSIARIIVERAETEWLIALGYSYLLYRSLT